MNFLLASALYKIVSPVVLKSAEKMHSAHVAANSGANMRGSVGMCGTNGADSMLASSVTEKIFVGIDGTGTEKIS